MKKIYIILALLATVFPVCSWAMEEVDNNLIEAELTPAVQLTVSGSQVRVTGATGKTLEIYDLAGVRVGTIKIDSEDKTLHLNLQRGCYFLKVGKVVRKVSIR